MENKFCISKSELIKIFWGGMAEDRLNAVQAKFADRYSWEEILQQTENEEGEVGKFNKEENEKFSNKNINNEIANAVTLADLYFLESDPDICFEMKHDFKKKKIDSCEDLIKNIESYTAIDCLIKDKDRKFNFQLKQYPEKYKEWSAEKVVEYLNKEILLESKYNNKNNKDLIIVITIKPEPVSDVKEKDFDEIHRHLSTIDIKLSEINFLYNRNSQYMVWFQVFPKKGYYKIPWQKLSYHEAKKSQDKNFLDLI